MSKVNCALLVYFVEAIKTTYFNARFNIGRIHVKQLLKWVVSSNTVSVKKKADVMGAKRSTRSKLLMLTMFPSFCNPNRQDKGTEQVRQVLQEFLAIVTYADKDPHVRKFFFTFFRALYSSVPLIQWGWCLHPILNSARQGFLATLDVTIASVLEV